MRRLRSPWARGLLVWSVVLGIVAVAVTAAVSYDLIRAQDACYFQTARCPTGDDPRVVRLTLVFLGFPLVWLIGLAVGIVGWARERRRGGPRP